MPFEELSSSWTWRWVLLHRPGRWCVTLVILMDQMSLMGSLTLDSADSPHDLHSIVEPLPWNSYLAGGECDKVSGSFQLQHIQQWSADLRKQIAHRVETETRLQTSYHDGVTAENLQHAAALAALTEAYDAEQVELERRLESDHEHRVTHWAAELQAFESEVSLKQKTLSRTYESERADAEKKREETEWLVGSLLDDEADDSPQQHLARLQSQTNSAAAEMQQAVSKAERQRVEALAHLARCRLSLEPSPIEPPEPVDDLKLLQERCLQAAEEADRPHRQLMRQWLPYLFQGMTPFIASVIIAAGLGTGAWFGVTPAQLGINGTAHDPGWIAIIGVGSCALTLVALFLLHAIANQRVNYPLSLLFARARTSQASLSRWQRLANEEMKVMADDLERRHLQRVSHREGVLQKAEANYEVVAGDAQTRFHRSMQKLTQETSGTRMQLQRQRDEDLQRSVFEAQSERQAFAARKANDFAFLAREHAQRLAEFEQERRQGWTDLQQEWVTGIGELTARAQSWNEEACAEQPSWKSLLRDADGPVSLVVKQAPRIRLGGWNVSLNDIPDGVSTAPALQTDISAWPLPCMLDVSEHTGVLLQSTGSAGRAAATEWLRTAMLRLLTTLPPGRVRFMIIDPVGLGEGFSAFMHLADIDELLVTSRIWTEPNAIEERLADLTEHIETVLQMFLRNEFPTLEAYNQQAGEVAEPYRVLVVLGMPAHFTDIALRRLWNIVSGGPKCGVIPLIHVDVGQPLPRGFSLGDLAQKLLTLEWKPDGFHAPGAELSRWPLTVDAPPPPEMFTAIVKKIGLQASDVRRVEVPFQRVAPNADAVWTRSAAKGVDVPIGRAGATKSQSIMLGSGTSQHVLVAGKTGSGKSTLLHALITNAALYYSPTELEFYLIDFKKGVEFQTYARQKLPHARVIAIESDREFGVSVLERLDTLLQDRSTTFRDAGVNDLPSFRAARPQVVMPRVLLIIDEFQEFFVEDDSLSQTAGLLLDRLIRQGRAFGVHVILGSQTLAGAYSLARSTLGQVAVRIALQCSETDAHLILSEENSAARLLTRPGEAIYNDANGLPAGNHLFQVVWLDDTARDQYLKSVRQRADQQGLQTTPAIVFEGNVPADVSKLPQTNGVIKTNGAATVWLGEAVSLRGALPLEFLPAVGFNLLLMGQDESAALGVLAAAALSVTNDAHGAQSVWWFNGSPQEQTANVLQALRSKRSALKQYDIPDIDARLAELVEEVRKRDGQPGPRIWLCLFDLVRFRKLRKKDDDYGFGSFDKKGGTASPPDMLAEILRDGPSVGIHTWIWCDSVNTLSRWLSREAQGHFEQRIAFAMNASDSSQFIDTPAASRLGPNRAWLFRGDRGTLEKFRPYSPPA